MKKLLLFALPLLALTFVACSGDNKNKNEGSITFAEVTVPVTDAYMEYYGEVEDGVVNVDLTFESEGNGAVYFYMNVAEPNNKLVNGIYTFDLDSSSYEAGTFYEGGLYLEEENVTVYITAGTVTIAVNDGRYTISFNCTIQGGETLTGSYKGALGWSDETVV